MRFNTAAFAATVIVPALFLAGCGAGSQHNAGDTGSAGSRAPAGLASAKPVSNDYALHYTGGTPAAANSGESPVVVGYINQQGGVPSFPEATAGLDAAIKYVNAELGGVQRHPVTVNQCLVQSAEDSQRCAAQMANDPAVKFVLIGQLAVGNSAVYRILSGNKPMIQASPGTVADLTAKGSYAYTPGGPGLIAGMALFTAKDLGPVKRVAVVYASNPAGSSAAQQFLKPLLQQFGVPDVKLVGVADNASGPDVAAAVQASGAANADVLITFVTPPGCIAVSDAVRSLHLKSKVVATGLCFDTSVTQHLHDIGVSGQVPPWYYGAFGYSYFLADKPADNGSGMATYLAKMKQYGPASVNYTGFAGSVFADLLTAVKFANEIGVDSLTSQAFEKKAATFTGPMMLTAGPMKCGFAKMFPALCGSRVGIEQYTGGHWLPTAQGSNAIDISQVLGG